MSKLLQSPSGFEALLIKKMLDINLMDQVVTS